MCFNGHPPLGVNATSREASVYLYPAEFQWAPTLGGECYLEPLLVKARRGFGSFNGHPPLGVNATR